ncbi:hypothetical protein mRhiFer1_008263 [Rhinolophus ferrumequinum]|uniref:Uncharacterized protein n=1 Tax=Rhinolophus ferrumequinum TaxID=59479 RepID=A0A7J7VQN8_RHIFE|nr:hypothetical protein mRhiFer1_008263 [Rhinolophus ferrumequinum]
MRALLKQKGTQEECGTLKPGSGRDKQKRLARTSCPNLTLGLSLPIKDSSDLICVLDKVNCGPVKSAGGCVFVRIRVQLGCNRSALGPPCTLGYCGACRGWRILPRRLALQSSQRHQSRLLEYLQDWARGLRGLSLCIDQ